MEERQRGAKSAAGASKGRPTGPPPQPTTKPPPPTNPFYIPLNTTLLLLTLSHTLAALTAPILDCDETFNYWEPLHYLLHRSGLQTWEYSPDYAIRSWAYIVLHALPTSLISFLSPLFAAPSANTKVIEFYGLRVLLGVVCACTETRLYSAIARTLNPRIAVFYLLITLFSPGIFYASVAFLPSSFAMHTSTLGLASFMDWLATGGAHNRTASGIMWFGLGALLGWPFAGALILPFVGEDWLVALVIRRSDPDSDVVFETFRRYLDGIVRCLLILALQVGVDAFFYHKIVFVPLRIVLYNVISADGTASGPNIFGTEPWHYYLRNLLLNFNLFSVLALLAAPLLVLQTLFFRAQTTKQTLLRTIVLLTPFYLWLGIFTAQPHKEERFMYPAYPFLALNAAIALHMLLTWIGSSDKRTLIGRVPPQVKLALILPTLAGAIALSVLRIAGTVTAYRAPLQIYTALSQQNNSTNVEGGQAMVNVCHARTWHHFPASFHLPSQSSSNNNNKTPQHRARFIPSAFHGLLPGPFSEAHTGFGFWPGTYLPPSGMNDRNIEDPAKYIDIQHCDYLVDFLLPDEKGNEEEPLYVAMTEEWERAKCERWLDKEGSGAMGRVLWVPEWEAWVGEGLAGKVPGVVRRKWGEMCLLRRKGREGEGGGLL